MRFIGEIALRAMAFFECRGTDSDSLRAALRAVARWMFAAAHMPRRCAPRNDILFDTVSANFGAEGMENHCHCEEA